MRIWITGDDCEKNKQAVAEALRKDVPYWRGYPADVHLEEVLSHAHALRFDARVVLHQGHAHVFTPDNHPPRGGGHEDSTFTAITRAIESTLFFCEGRR